MTSPARPTEPAEIREALAADIGSIIRSNVSVFLGGVEGIDDAASEVASAMASLFAQYDDAATAQAERTAGELAAAKAEILALLAPSPAERPCDCEHCYCGNSGDLAAVAAWDAERRLHDAAVAIFDRAALTEEPPHAAE